MQSNSFFEYLCNEISWQRLLKVRANLRKKLAYQDLLMREKRYKEHNLHISGMCYRILRDVEKAMRYRNPLYTFRMFKRSIPEYEAAAYHPLFRPWRTDMTTNQYWEYRLEYRRNYAASILLERAEGKLVEYEWSLNSCYDSACRARKNYNEAKASNSVHPAKLAEYAGEIYLDYKTIEIITKAIENSVHDRGRVLCCA